MGLFERTYLSDKNSSAPCRGLIRGLHCKGPMESHPLVEADHREGRLHCRSRYGLEKSAIPSRPVGGPLFPSKYLSKGSTA
jgi:hypothetical protein